MVAAAVSVFPEKLPIFDAIEPVQRGNVVRAQLGCIRNALPSAPIAEPLDRMHDRPALQAGRGWLVIGEHLLIRLRPVQPQHMAKSANELILDHRDLTGRGGAQPVHQDQRMRDIAGYREAIDGAEDPTVLARQRRAGAGPVDRVDDRTVLVIDHRDRFAGCVGLNVRRHGDAARSGHNIGSVHVLAQAAAALD